MSTILSDYFNAKLVEAGFPSGLQICYSLSYCQGDGMAFYGALYARDWVRLFNEMNPRATLKVRRRFRFLANHICLNEVDNIITIARNSFGYRYSHWNTMEVRADLGQYFEFDGIRYKDRPVFIALWDEFITDLKNYVQNTSKELEHLGYRIIQSAWIDDDDALETINTPNYRVEFKVKPVHFYDYRSAEDFGYESALQLCADAMEGTKFVDLSASVISKSNDITMATRSLGFCVYDRQDKTYAGNKRYLVSEAIEEARLFAQQAVKNLQHLRPAMH